MSSNDLDQLLRDVQALKDIEAIKRLKHAYFRCIDTADIAGLRTLLTDDVTTRFNGGSHIIELHGPDEYCEMIANAFNSDVVAQHNGHHPEIDLSSENEATGIWYLYDHVLDFRGMTELEGTAIYHDRYVKVDGAWKIGHTEYERIWETNTDITERPTLSAHYLATHGRTDITYVITETFGKHG